MVDVGRTIWCSAVGLLLAGACSPAPDEVNTSASPSGDPASSTGASGETLPETSEGQEATVADGTRGMSGSSSEGSATTLPLDDSGTTASAESSTTSGSTGDPSSSSSEGEEEGGSQGDCQPLLAEVYYDTQSGEDNEQWVKLYNPCEMEIDLGHYSLGWGGANYTIGTMDLVGVVGSDECFIVGGPLSNADNAMPMLDQPLDFNPNLEKSGGTADGVALFLGGAGGIMVATVPIDAVIYGGNNTSNLLDANGNTPAPHVGDAGDSDSIRRTAVTTWAIENNPMPGLCPPY